MTSRQALTCEMTFRHKSSEILSFFLHEAPKKETALINGGAIGRPAPLTTIATRNTVTNHTGNSLHAGNQGQ